MTTVNEIVGLVLLLVLSGFFSGSETALTAISLARVEELDQSKRAGARSLLRLKRRWNRTLIAILIGNNLVNIGASALATVIATERFGRLGPGLAVGVLTLVILIFGEVTPKSFAALHATPIALTAAPPLVLFSWLVLPLTWVLEHFTVRLHAFTGPPDPTVTESELIRMARYGLQEGTIEQDEKEMIERAFALDRLHASDIMTPRHRVVSFDGARTVEDCVAEIVEAGHSRFPVYRDNPEVITGVVHLRKVLRTLVEGRGHLTLDELAHQPLFVHFRQRVDVLLDELRSNERNLVVVVDDLGAVGGILTLEDLLEELVGEIYHSEEEVSTAVRALPDGRLMVEGAAEIRELRSGIKVDLSGKPTDSVNKWLLSRTQRIPAAGERLEVDGLEIEIAKASVRRIYRLIITPPDHARGPA